SGPSTGATTGSPSTTVPSDPLAGLRVAAEGPRTGYDRNLFGNWIDADHDRCDTREEVLQAQSTTPPQTDYSGTACKVMAGDWMSLYDGAVLTDRTEVEIDHVVALAEAWDSGASAWDATRRHAFANDLAHPELLAVSSSTNHAKGDLDPAQWSPPRAAAQCAFASDTAAVKVAWNLSADPAEVAALRRMLATCPGGSPTSTTTSGPTVTTSTTVPTGATTGLLAVVGLDCPGEGVTIRNGGSAAADLSGWSIHDDGDKHSFAFPAGYHLAPGASATVRSGGPAGPGELQWLNAAVWNNDGDTASLVDAAGTLRSTRSC
ncbi:MAG TPA: lamin tail domain-containing protein, partial [Acidimicrobiia bacterium]|nr:lamin tail domain-containing protein [Acidimicrobiia bacterium]